jgi:hypothetical protein
MPSARGPAGVRGRSRPNPPGRASREGEPETGAEPVTHESGEVTGVAAGEAGTMRARMRGA